MSTLRRSTPTTTSPRPVQVSSQPVQELQLGGAWRELEEAEGGAEPARSPGSGDGPCRDARADDGDGQPAPIAPAPIARYGKPAAGSPGLFIGSGTERWVSLADRGQL